MTGMELLALTALALSPFAVLSYREIRAARRPAPLEVFDAGGNVHVLVGEQVVLRRPAPVDHEALGLLDDLSEAA